MCAVQRWTVIGRGCVPAINVPSTPQDGLVLNLLWLFPKRNCKAHAKSIYLHPHCVLHIDCLLRAQVQSPFWANSDLSAINKNEALAFCFLFPFFVRFSNYKCSDAMKRPRKFIMNAECVKILLSRILNCFLYFVSGCFGTTSDWVRRDEI